MLCENVLGSFVIQVLKKYCKMSKFTSDCFIIEFNRNEIYEENELLPKSNVKLINDEPDCCTRKLKDLMKFLKNVKQLVLICKNITTIPSDFFMANLKIKYLTISGEKIVNFGDGLFTNLTRLVELNLSVNNLLFYPSHIILGSGLVKKLVISASFASDSMIDNNMNIAKIKDLTLENFKNHRPYPLVDVNNFRLLEHLERLKLSCVTLKEKFQYNFYHLTTLILLKSSVSFIGLFGLSKTIPCLENLYFEKCDINLRQNLILRRNEKLKYLSMIHCKLQVIPRELLVCYDNLDTLNLKGNAIKSIDNDSFSMNKQLVALDLSYNEIFNVDPDCFITLKKLVVLNLQHNEITNSCLSNRPLLFENMLALKYVNMYENPITKLCLSLFHANHQLDEICIEKDKMNRSRKFSVVSPKTFDQHVYNLFQHD